MTAPSIAFADILEADGTAYSGRLISAVGNALIFDFDCSGDIRTFQFLEEMKFDITGDCSAPEIFGIGGSEVCASNAVYRNLYVVQYLAVNSQDSFIYAFDHYSYDGEVFIVGLGDEINILQRGTYSVKRISSEYCAQYYGREIP